MKPLNEFDYEKTRLKRQEINIRKWIGNNRIGTITAATGYGKTTLGIFAIRNIIKFTEADNKFLICVPSNYLKQQWESIIKEHEIDQYCDVVVINTLIKNKYNATLLVLDEIHRYKAPEFKKVYDCVNYKSVIGLTATLDDKDPKYQIINNNCPIVDQVPVKECLENNWVSNFNIYTIGVDLDKDAGKQYEEKTNKIKKYMSTFDFNFQKMVACLDENKANSWAKYIHWNPKVVYLHALNGMRAVNSRKDIISECQAKINKTKEIIDYLNDRKIIVFSKKTDTVDQLSKLYPDSISYHSKLPTIIRNKDTKQIVGKKDTNTKGIYHFKGNIVSWDEIDGSKYERVSCKRQLPLIINDYVNDKYNILFTAKAVDEGMDIPSADTSITINAASSKRQATQRRGRVIRYQPDKTALDIHIYVRDTKDEDWVKSRLEGVPNIVDVENIHQIKLQSNDRQC